MLHFVLRRSKVTFTDTLQRQFTLLTRGLRSYRRTGLCLTLFVLLYVIAASKHWPFLWNKHPGSSRVDINLCFLSSAAVSCLSLPAGGATETLWTHLLQAHQPGQCSEHLQDSQGNTLAHTVIRINTDHSVLHALQIYVQCGSHVRLSRPFPGARLSGAELVLWKLLLAADACSAGEGEFQEPAVGIPCVPTRKQLHLYAGPPHTGRLASGGAGGHPGQTTTLPLRHIPSLRTTEQMLRWEISRQLEPTGSGSNPFLVASDSIVGN